MSEHGPLARLAADRERAVARIADLERDLASIAEATAAGPDDEHDVEGPTVAYERARVGFLLDQAKGQLSAIDAALAGGGRYGRCERCGGTIAQERLEALPATRYCVRCAAEG